jgi:hypothetical protein
MVGLDGYEVYLDQAVTARLSLAVRLTDEYTGKTPIGSAAVYLEGLEVKPVKNLSGYYLFLDLPAGEYRVLVETAYYFAQDITVSLPLPDPDPVVEIILKPGPSYPFSPGATLIRGMVEDSQGNQSAGAVVSSTVPDFDTLTAARGEFVCCYTGLSDEDIVIINGKRVLIGEGEQKISLQVTYNSLSGGVEVENVAEGEVTVLASPIIINET